MVPLVLLVLLVLLVVLVVLVELENMYPKVQTEQTVRLHLPVQTITMWLQATLMLLIREHIITITTTLHIPTNTDTL